jgi:hypothetical protein
VSDFYTIGLPRSRSLWLSKLLNYGDSTCFHEHLSSHAGEIRPEVTTKYRGFCDTNPLITVDYGDSPVLKVLRDPEEVVISGLTKFDAVEDVVSWYDFLTNYIADYAEALDGIAAQMTVSVADLGNPEIVQSICKFLMPDNPVPTAYIEDMIITRIETTNRDLTASLKQTAEATGRSYKDVLAKYDIPTYHCERIFDIALVVNTMNAMWDAVSEDGAPPYKPDLMAELWIGIYMGGSYIGMFRLHQLTSVCWQGHIFILPEQRRHTDGIGKAMKQWIYENLDAKKIIAEVPECYPNVVAFLERHGFTKQGFNADSFSKNGLIGTHQLGMKTEDMR